MATVSGGLTVKYIEALQRRLNAGETVDQWHSEPSGLTLRVRPNGRMSYLLRKGRRPAITLGPVEIGLANARALANEALVQLARGIDPTEERKAAKAAKAAAEAAPANSFADVAEQFIERYCRPKLRSWKNVSTGLARDATPKWGKLPIAEISRPMVAELIDSIVDRGSPRQAALVHAYLHRLFRWAIGRGFVDSNPVSDLEKPHSNAARERVLSDEELRLVWTAAERIGWPFGPIVHLLILSGQRKSEIAAGTWLEVDLDAATWSLPPSRVKNKKPHIFPLAPKAVEIIRALPRFEGAEFIFTTTGESTVSGFSRALRNLNREIEAISGRPIEPWTLHDLRRTAATRMGDLGVAPHVIEAILNHQSGSKAGVAGIYNRSLYAAEMKAALAAWARRVHEIVADETPDNVVRLRRS
jgi:integrase